MCEACAQTVTQAQMLIDAIDKNREALLALLDQIHRDMNQTLVINISPDDTETPVDIAEDHVGAVMLANYIAGFLYGELLPDEKVTSSISHFFNTGYDHGGSYTTFRKHRLN